MRKKLTKHGNSHALLIEKAVLELLNWNPAGEFEITTDGTALTIKPAVGIKAKFAGMVEPLPFPDPTDYD